MAEQVFEQIRDGTQKLLAGEMDEKTFKEWLKQSHAKLDALKVEKDKSAEFWRKYNATCYY
jgi:hypothetical protein